MTPKEYQSRLEALKKQELELAQEFIKDNPLKELEGKLVNLTIGCSHQRVMFIGAYFTKDTLEPAYFYQYLKKDGTPRKNADYILVKLYDGKFFKFERL